MNQLRIPYVLALAATSVLALAACNEAAVESGEVLGEVAQSAEAVSEGSTARKPRARFTKMFDEADGDSDGKLTEAEVRTAAKARFGEVDTDSDGFLSEDERMAMRASFVERGHGPGRRGARLLERFDEDGDGKISEDEAPSRLAQHFDRVDADGDGQVTLEEMRSMALRRGMKRFGQRMDADGDGKLSSSEFVDARVARWKRADVDGDDAVTKEEIRSAIRNKRGHFRGRGRGPGMKPRERGGRFAAMDANDDGKVTKAEMEVARKARFDAIDANGDGTLTTEEMEAARPGPGRLEGRRPFMLRMDSDGDGAVSRAEFETAGGTWFDRLDEDGDGAVASSELPFHRRGPRGHGPRR